MTKAKIPSRTIERLVLYQRLMAELLAKGRSTFFSHQLALLAHSNPAQVRRDLMSIGQSGGPRRGYETEDTLKRITSLLTGSKERRLALVGVGNLGRAILSYFAYRHPGLTIVAAFDSDPAKADRVISGCRCYGIHDFTDKATELEATIGIITVPGAHAQQVADLMVASGMKGILNFAPVPLKVPEGIHTDRIDIASSLEKLAYFADRAE